MTSINQSISDNRVGQAGSQTIDLDSIGNTTAVLTEVTGKNRARFSVEFDSGTGWGATELEVQGTVDGNTWVTIGDRITAEGLSGAYVFECLAFLRLRVAVADGNGDGVATVVSMVTREEHAPVDTVEKWVTGDIKQILGAVPNGWLELDGSTIGNVGSGADIENAGFFDLFELVKTLSPNAGTESWAGGDTVTLPNAERRVLVGAGGTGTGTLGSAVGSTGGAETHTLTASEMPAHTHDVNRKASAGVAQCLDWVTGTATTETTTSAGSGSAHNNIQPSLVVRMVVKI